MVKEDVVGESGVSREEFNNLTASELANLMYKRRQALREKELKAKKDAENPFSYH